MFFGNAPQGFDAIAHLCRLFEIQTGGVAFHQFDLLVDQLVALAVEKQLRLLDLALITFPVGMADAGSGTAFDLVLQAGAGAVGHRRIFAIAQLEHALHVIDGVANRAGAGERSVKSPLSLVGFAPENPERRVVMLAEADIGVTFVVAKQDVVARVQIFD